MKNKDYGDSFNISLDTYGEIAFKVRAQDKVLRINNLIKSKDQVVADEKLEDTILDLYGYCVQFAAWKSGDTSLGKIVGLYYETDLTGFEDLLEQYELLSNCSSNVMDEIAKVIPVM
jgi:hypothetical protein